MKGSPEEEQRVVYEQDTANAAQDIEKMKQQTKELEEEIKTEKDPNIKKEKTIKMLKIYITLYPDIEFYKKALEELETPSSAQQANNDLFTSFGGKKKSNKLKTKKSKSKKSKTKKSKSKKSETKKSETKKSKPKKKK
jgi:hypothetical protein